MENVYFKTTLNELVKLQKDTDVVISKREKENGSPLYCEGSHTWMTIMIYSV